MTDANKRESIKRLEKQSCQGVLRRIKKFFFSFKDVQNYSNNRLRCSYSAYSNIVIIRGRSGVQ